MLDVLALLPFIVAATAALSATAPRVQLTFSPAHAIHEGTVGTLASRSISQAGQAPSDAAVVWATPTRVRTRSKQRSPWDETDILAPDVTDLDTLTELSRLASNAYNEPGSKSWYDVPGWNNTLPIGTEDPSGMRGHLFASSDNSTIVLAVKGTNLPFSGPTSGRDKQNDNTMFSCCCAHSACSCASRGNKCDTACLETALAEESMFYNFGINLYNNVTYLYPDATIWIVGHSLGGALAALLSATFGAPTVTFSSPGERRAARLLHLPQSAPVTHVIHTADPVSYGTCVTCARAGYSLETRCHLGRVIEFDTQSRFGWRGDIRHHPLSVMINKVLGAGGLWPDPHNPGNDTGSTWVTVPDAREQLDCQDCYKWTYDDDQSLLRMQTSHMQT